MSNKVEIHGVCEYPDPENPGATICVANAQTPDFFSVYLRYDDGEAQCVADSIHWKKQFVTPNNWPQLRKKYERQSESYCR
jgi:hypothetical protein